MTARRKKTQADYLQQSAIESALASLAVGTIPAGLEALAEAVRAKDWRLIADAALTIEHMTTAEIILESEIIWIATGNPKRFGVEKIYKCDVIRIMQAIRPGWEPPANASDMWRRLGLEDLPQGRGGENEKALEAWERLHAKGLVNRWTMERLVWAAAVRSGKFREEMNSVSSGEVDGINVSLMMVLEEGRSKELRQAVIVQTISEDGSTKGACIVPLRTD